MLGNNVKLVKSGQIFHLLLYQMRRYIIWPCAGFLMVCIWLLPAFSEAQILKKPIPNKTVVLTFDDAPASHYSHVAPLLKEKGFGATFFVCEFPPNHTDSTKYMNWRQMQALDRMGFEVANHTHTHAPVGKLPEEKIRWEMEYIENKMDSLKWNLPSVLPIRDTA